MHALDQTVRSLRFQLAAALLEGKEDGAGEAEALALLDRAIDEPGDQPSAGRIHLTAADVLVRRHDDAGALDRYLLAAADEAGEAVPRARRLLASSSQPGALVAMLSPDAVERLVAIAQDQPSGEVAPLAATLLRQRGNLEASRDLLERACAGKQPSPDVGALLADVLLDLGQSERALGVVEELDPAGTDPVLGVVRAKVYLVGGDTSGASAIADHVWSQTHDPAAAAVRALCLVGLDRTSEALAALPTTDHPDVQSARVVAALAHGDETVAREGSWSLIRARPNDADAQLLSAQTAVEMLGQGRDAGSRDGQDPAPGIELDTARQLLEESASALPPGGPRSFWWCVQEATRSTQARFQYFRAELRFALGLEVSLDELEAIDIRYTTYLQDAAIDELMVKRLARERDPSRTAAVHDHATTIFVNHVPDTQRASAHAREAWTLDPSPARAAEFADRAFYASLPDDAASKTNEDLEAALEATERALPEATDDDLIQLLNARAWVLQRLGDAPKGSVSARLPWILAGAAVHPRDGVLLAVAGWDAQALGHKAAGVLLAAEGLSRQPDDATTRESALTTSVSYDVERARSLPYPESPGQTDEGWQNAVELYVALHGSDWNRVAEALDRPLSDDAWVKRTHALGLALLHGLDAAETALNEALDASWDDRENLHSRALVAAVLRSPEQLDRIVAEEADEPDADRVRGECALTARFVADSTMTPEMYLQENLRFCFCPADVFGLVNLALPLLVAARTGEKPAIEPRWSEEPAVQRRLADVSDPAAAWLVERETAGSWWKLAELAMHAGEPGAVIDLIRSAPGGTSGLPAAVVERLERLVLRRACAEMPRRALDALAGRGPDVPSRDVAALFDPDVDAVAEDRLAVALLLDSPAPAPTEDEVAATVDRIVTLVSTTTDERGEAVRDLWTLDARLREAAATPAWTAVAALARPRLMTALDDLFGLRSPVDVNPYTLPVIGEVADDLVPFVDDSQDNGHFLFELVPAMRSRIHSNTGVEVLGIRVRPDPNLLAGGFRILIDEVPVHSGSVAASDPDAIPDALIHEFESELRRHLDRFLGPAEVEQALTLWQLDDDDQLVTSVVPDADAILLLTWVLQALLRDGLPIVDWRSILRTIQRQGGLKQPPSALHQALRAELQVHLPGRQQGRERVPLPPDLEAAVIGKVPPDASPELRSAPHHAFRRWLLDQLSVRGPSMTLLVGTDEVRRIVDELAHAENPSVETLSVAELP